MPWWKKLIAFLHWNDRIVCEVSATMGDRDYHDYCDTREKEPDHFIPLTCERCGKKFYI